MYLIKIYLKFMSPQQIIDRNIEEICQLDEIFLGRLRTSVLITDIGRLGDAQRLRYVFLSIAVKLSLLL